MLLGLAVLYAVVTWLFVLVMRRVVSSGNQLANA
jgi:hypothetical protein